MKIARAAAPLVMALALTTASCGGGGAKEITGPILDISDITSIVLDQLFMNGGMEDEYGSRGEFSVYVRDSATGVDLACTRLGDGMDELASAGVYYGELDVPFTKVEGSSVESLARFKLIFVEKDGGECPEPIGAEDDIAGESAELTSESLLDLPIWASNGRAAAVLRAAGDDPLSVRSMAPALAEGLYIDKLYFDYEVPEGTTPRFYINADVTGHGQCQIEDDLMAALRAGRLLYAALGFPIPCLDGADPDFPDMEVSLSLYAQEASGPKLIGQTEPAFVADLVGERARLEGNDGYVTFRSISPAWFGSPVVRISDLAATQITGLVYVEDPDSAGALEVHAVDVASGKTVACSGLAQGLDGLGAAGTYDNLTALFVAAGWENELFGFDSVRFNLVERTDGLACPTLPSESLPVLAATGELDTTKLATGHAGFASGGGIDFAEAPGN